MQIKSLFNNNGQWEEGEVEVQLLPGIPALHVVGLPDLQIRESGVKLKAAVKSLGLKWPLGQKIIVNLRPNHLRKSGAGVELAIALGFLAKSGQLSQNLTQALSECVVYGEVALDGRVMAPFDVAQALTHAKREILTGVVGENVRSGEWRELESLKSELVTQKSRYFNWDEYWERPSIPQFDLHIKAAEVLKIAAHAGLHVLLAGPQGSGKSTWARMLYGLLEAPDTSLFMEREGWLGPDPELKWRPFEQPHHSTTPLAMVGGGYPIVPGVVTRAHGGMLLLDEFLEFHPAVLENLREPVEGGVVEIARRGGRERMPARFQLVGTTNLCPCGKLYPDRNAKCTRPLNHCGSTLRRLSGPLLDRFDVLALTHLWNGKGERVSLEQIQKDLLEMKKFKEQRGPQPAKIPEWMDVFDLSFRRRNSLLRVARALADGSQEENLTSRHITLAMEWVVNPMEELSRIFA